MKHPIGASFTSKWCSLANDLADSDLWKRTVAHLALQRLFLEAHQKIQDLQKSFADLDIADVERDLVAADLQVIALEELMKTSPSPDREDVPLCEERRTTKKALPPAPPLGPMPNGIFRSTVDSWNRERDRRRIEKKLGLPEEGGLKHWALRYKIGEQRAAYRHRELGSAHALPSEHILRPKHWLLGPLCQGLLNCPGKSTSRAESKSTWKTESSVVQSKTTGVLQSAVVDMFNAVKSTAKEDGLASRQWLGFVEAIEEQFHVAPPKQILQPADEPPAPVAPVQPVQPIAPVQPMAPVQPAQPAPAPARPSVPKPGGALLSKNDVGVVTEELPPGSPKPLKVKGPSGRVGNYRYDELLAEQDLLISITALADLILGSSVTVPDVSALPSPAKAAPVATKGEPDVERFSQLPIEKRTIPVEKWEEEVLKKNRRFVLFFNSSNERLSNGEQFLKWRLTDLAQPEPRNVTVPHLRWQASVHWRKPDFAKKASRGAIIAILNPTLIEFESKSRNGGKETLLLVENPKSIEKLGECPTLGSCKKKGCKLPCNLSLKETYCQLHLGAIYASKSVRVAMGGADAKAAAVLGQKRPASKIAREVKEAKLEAAAKEEAAGQEGQAQDDEATRAKQEREQRMQLALHLDDRRFHTAEANESYVKFVRKGMKAEDAYMSRVPQLGRGLDDSGLELFIP
eukprot:Skav203296  [mRNA]  locus=scaffold2189:29323:47402:- [translate_table: standard]